MKTSTLLFGILLAVIQAGVIGCAKKESAATPVTHAHAHTHEAKHGGVLAELGEEEFHLEFVFGDKPGVLQAYVLDGELDNYVRIDAPAFSAMGTSAGKQAELLFQATTNSATGEKVGDSALFEATTTFTGKPAITITVPALTMKGRTYRDITVNLPAAK